MRPRSWFGLKRLHWLMLAVMVLSGIGLAVGADHIVDQISSSRPLGSGRVVKCGRYGALVHPFSRSIKVRLDDGREVDVVRVGPRERDERTGYPGSRPVCGSRIAVAERTTPWRGTWVSIARRENFNSK